MNGSCFGCEKKDDLRILTLNKKLKDEAKDILRICKEFDILFGFGHAGPERVRIALTQEGKRIVCDKLEITPQRLVSGFQYRRI